VSGVGFRMLAIKFTSSRHPVILRSPDVWFDPLLHSIIYIHVCENDPSSRLNLITEQNN
jgi:hypothetical protein